MAKSIASQKQIEFVVIFKALACLLILNSHCRDIYPIMFFAVGGGHGNALFFALSGFCLVNIQQPFFQWYWKRIRRILPISLLIAAVGVIGAVSQQKIAATGYDVLAYCLNQYWFVWAILIYYIAYYFVFRRNPRKYGIITLAAHLIGYVILYLAAVNRQIFSVELEGFSPFKVYFYFSVFVCGGLLHVYSDQIKACRSRKMLVALFVAGGLSLVIWCMEYALIMIWNKALTLQYLIQFSVFLFAAVAIMLGICVEQRIKIPQGIVGRIIRILSNCTLEIYLVQVTFKSYIVNLPFPCSWVAFFAGSIVIGALLHDIKRIGRCIRLA